MISLKLLSTIPSPSRQDHTSKPTINHNLCLRLLISKSQNLRTVQL